MDHHWSMNAKQKHWSWKGSSWHTPSYWMSCRCLQLGRFRFTLKKAAFLYKLDPLTKLEELDPQTSALQCCSDLTVQTQGPYVKYGCKNQEGVKEIPTSTARWSILKTCLQHPWLKSLQHVAHQINRSILSLQRLQIYANISTEHAWKKHASIPTDLHLHCHVCMQVCTGDYIGQHSMVPPPQWE